MKVRVRDGFQINHQGKLHRGGESIDAPDALAQRWVDMGIAEKAKPKKKAVSKSKNKAVESSVNKAASPKSGSKAK